MELLESNLSPARAANLCGEDELSQSTLSNNDTFQSNLMPSPSIPNIRMDDADDTFEKINICSSFFKSYLRHCLLKISLVGHVSGED